MTRPIAPSGLTFFTAETHLNYYREMKAGEPFTIETQLVGLDEKRMHLFHRMLHGKTGELVATNEIMQLHVDQKAQKVAPMRADIFEALSAVWAAHKKLKKPAELGRVMGVPVKDRKRRPRRLPRRKGLQKSKPGADFDREEHMLQRVMITAGGSGIGRAIAKAFADEGAKVHICDVDEQALGEVTEKYPQIAATHVDVTDERSDRSVVRRRAGRSRRPRRSRQQRRHQGADRLCRGNQLDDWRECLSVCLDAHFLCARRAAPVMKDQNSGTHHQYFIDRRPLWFRHAHALCGRQMGGDRLHQVACRRARPLWRARNAICPGAVRGARMDRVIAAEAEQRGVASDVVDKEYAQGQSIRRFVEPEEIADMCLFLASPAAKMVTGQAIAVDGHTETFHIGS